MDEESYLEGRRRAWLQMLGSCLTALGENGNPAQWVLERQETIAALRRLCAIYGDNDWPDDMFLPEVLQKHLTFTPPQGGHEGGMMMAQHRHTVSYESAPRPMNGMCSCPGCRNAFSRIKERCACGAERIVCSGVGTASLQCHRAHGYSLWQMPGQDKEED